MLSSKLMSIIRVTLGLLLYLQQSFASDQQEEDDKMLQFQRFLETKDFEQKAPEASYGDFDVLSEDILFHQLLPYCDYKIIQLNSSFFTLVTGYESDHIFDQGFESKPTRPVCFITSNAMIDFKRYEYNMEQIPSFIWYSLMRKVRGIFSPYWPYFKESQIQTVNLKGNQIGDNGVQSLGQSLQDTHVQILNLSFNQIEDNGARDLGQSLQSTQVHTVDLGWNQIEAQGARDLGQSLQSTQVHTVNLGWNQIGAIGARDFGQCLQGTQIHTVDLSYNQIGDDGAISLGHALKKAKVQTLYLMGNNTNQETHATLRDILPGVTLIF